MKNLGEQETKENIRYYVDYIYLLAIYHYKQGNMSNAINISLEILILSGKIKDDSGFKKSAALYEILRDHASQSQQQVHKNIMKTILEREFYDEKDIILADSLSLD